MVIKNYWQKKVWLLNLVKTCNVYYFEEEEKKELVGKKKFKIKKFLAAQVLFLPFTS